MAVNEPWRPTYGGSTPEVKPPPWTGAALREQLSNWDSLFIAEAHTARKRSRHRSRWRHFSSAPARVARSTSLGVSVVPESHFYLVSPPQRAHRHLGCCYSRRLRQAAEL